jgi:hypothetical protein
MARRTSQQVAEQQVEVEQQPDEVRRGREWGSFTLPLPFTAEEAPRTTIVRFADGEDETEVMPLSPLALEWLKAHGYQRVVSGGYMVPLDDLSRLFRRRKGTRSSRRS